MKVWWYTGKTPSYLARHAPEIIWSNNTRIRYRSHLVDGEVENKIMVIAGANGNMAYTAQI